ncbi:TPA: ABC-2 transporter permease [Candidatus Bathyarchaeota archaeon]|nr:ABC-2 transporter permease [Candidatus Bathyarchaeota archaeon]
MARRVLRQVRRDRRTLVMMIAMPAIVMVIFGLALSGEVKNIPILVQNLDVGYEAQAGPGVSISVESGADLAEALQGDDSLRVVTGSYEDGVTGVDDGDYFAAVRIPADFSERLYRRMRGEDVDVVVDVYVDGTKPAIRASILGAVGDSLRSLGDGGGLEVAQVLAFGGAEYSGLDVSIPSVMGFVLTFLVLLISLIIINRETAMGTLQRLYTTPLTAFERLLGYVIALLVLGMMMSGVVLLVGVVFFQVTVRGSFTLLFISAFLYALTHVLLAVFLSNFARNELQAVQLAPIIALPSMALSGMLVPVNSLPDYIQPIARLVPLYYGNRVFEGVMLKGYGVGELSGDLLVISGMAAVFLILAAMTVKDRIDA